MTAARTHYSEWDCAELNTEKDNINAAIIRATEARDKATRMFVLAGGPLIDGETNGMAEAIYRGRTLSRQSRIGQDWHDAYRAADNEVARLRSRQNLLLQIIHEPGCS